MANSGSLKTQAEFFALVMLCLTSWGTLVPSTLVEMKTPSRPFFITLFLLVFVVTGCKAIIEEGIATGLAETQQIYQIETAAVESFKQTASFQPTNASKDITAPTPSQIAYVYQPGSEI